MQPTSNVKHLIALFFEPSQIEFDFDPCSSIKLGLGMLCIARGSIDVQVYVVRMNCVDPVHFNDCNCNFNIYVRI